MSRRGKPNLPKKMLLNRLQDIYGESFHPIMRMADNAAKMEQLIERVDPDDVEQLFVAYKSSIDAWGKIAEYTEPKMKAVEIRPTDRPKVKLVDLTGVKIDQNVIDMDDEDADDTD